MFTEEDAREYLKNLSAQVLPPEYYTSFQALSLPDQILGLKVFAHIGGDFKAVKDLSELENKLINPGF